MESTRRTSLSGVEPTFLIKSLWEKYYILVGLFFIRMEITGIDVEVVRFGREFGNVSAVKEIEASVFALLRLTADEGSIGIGEISDIEHPESMPSTDAIEREVEAFLLGEDPREINRLTAAMYDAIDFGPFDFHSFQQLALAAIDTALHDLVGTAYEVPAYQLLGGRTQDVPVCWVVYSRQGADALDALQAEVKTRVTEGFSAFKLKVGEVDLAVDEERIRTVREIAGEDAQVFADAQGVWKLEEAIEAVERLGEAGIDAIETPVGTPNLAAEAPGFYYDVPLIPTELSMVREETDVEIFEHVLDPEFGLALTAADAVDVFTVEVCAGGITRADRILSIAEGADIDARLGSTGELGPGTLAAGALGAASTAVSYPCDLAGPQIYDGSVLSDSLEYYDGTLRPLERPGFGFTLDSTHFA
jgi:muconate cycloisomerase